MSTANYAHKSFYAGYFEQDWSPFQRCRVNDLTVFQDFSQSSEKRRRYKILRAKIAAKISGKNPGALIYLRRGNAGVARAVENEAEIENLLVSRGFTIVDPSAPNPGEMLATLMGANLIVSIEGSHLYPFLYTLSQNGSLLVLEPPDRFNLVARDASECLGIKFGFIVGANVGTGYRFSTSDLLRMIDLLGN
jgi:hypothetical protein